jgi:hypothetical protein
VMTTIIEIGDGMLDSQARIGDGTRDAARSGRPGIQCVLTQFP